MEESLKDGTVVEKHFYGYELLRCPDVEHYTVPDEVVEVSPSAFEQAVRLVSIDFNNVKQLIARKEYIYDEEPYFEGTGWAGYEKTLTEIVFHSVLENCPLVSEIEMPHMEAIHEFALSGLKRVRSVTLPESMTVCSNFAFYDSSVESMISYGSVFNSTLHYNGNDIIYSDREGNRREINPDSFANNLCCLRQAVLYDKDTLRVRRAMWTLSKLSIISQITFSTPFIASMMRETYPNSLFADNIKDLGIEGESINRVHIVCFLKPQKYERQKNFGFTIILSDRDFVILEKLRKEHPEVCDDASAIQKHEPDLYNTIWNHVINDKNGGEAIERIEVRIEP